MRTPLTAVLGLTELAEMGWKGWTPEQVEDYLHDVRGAAMRLQELTSVLTDRLMLPDSDWAPELADVDVAALIQPAFERALEGFDGSMVGAITTVPAPVRGDAAALTTALAALIANAFAYAADDTPIEVVVHDADQVVVTVTNTGQAIAADRIEAMFEPLMRGPLSKRRRYNGLGMGLSVARRVARAHGGDVTLECRADGTTVAVMTVDPTGSPRG